MHHWRGSSSGRGKNCNGDGGGKRKWWGPKPTIQQKWVPVSSNTTPRTDTDRSHSSPRPPPLPPPAQTYVPAWEKYFLRSICRISWRRFSEARRYTQLFPKVIEWDDSAGRDALRVAKARFWAEINGQPHDYPLPDPDMYIDEVDHNAVIDPELVKDLEKRPPFEDDFANYFRWDSFLFTDKPVPISGWGDEEDTPSVGVIQPTGCD